MTLPTIMTQAEWFRDTNRTKWHGGNHKRSDALKEIDDALGTYNGGIVSKRNRITGKDEEVNQVASNDPTILEYLAMLIRNWQQGKTKRGVFTSIRDHSGAVTKLLRQCDLAIQLKNPVESDFPKIFIGNDLYRRNNWVPDTFVGAVETALQSIASRPVGRKLLEDIGKKCIGTKKVVIEYAAGARNSALPLPEINNENRKLCQALGNDGYSGVELLRDPALVGTIQTTNLGVKNLIPAAGTGAVILFDHLDLGRVPRPIFIPLAHELVHALHFVSGSCYRAAGGDLMNPQGNSGIMEEEMRTVGFDKYADEIPSENAIRDEHSIDRRKSYFDGVSWPNVTRSI